MLDSESLGVHAYRQHGNVLRETAEVPRRRGEQRGRTSAVKRSSESPRQLSYVGLDCFFALPTFRLPTCGS